MRFQSLFIILMLIFSVFVCAKSIAANVEEDKRKVLEMFRRLEIINSPKPKSDVVCIFPQKNEIKSKEEIKCPKLIENEKLEGQAVYVEERATVKRVLFHAKYHIDADGSPKAYHPEKGKGLDYLANAGDEKKWWGIATKEGEPCVQTESDPAPGYYVSTTALVDSSIRDECNPKRYVNSEEISYIVIPRSFIKEYGVELGDFVTVYNEKTQKYAHAIVADFGPSEKIGEGSIALAQKLGLEDLSPKKGGQSDGIRYLIYPKSKLSPALPKGSEAEKEILIQKQGEALLKEWGGLNQFIKCNL